MSSSIRLVDLRDVWDVKSKGGERDIAGRAAAMLVLARSFERPGHEESEIDYVPTQFLSSAFKSLGFDGLIYSSLMKASGHNVALFNPSVAIGDEVELYEVRDVHYWSSKVEEGPNQSPEPTATSVTPPAAQESRQP